MHDAISAVGGHLLASPHGTITHILDRMDSGDPEASNELFQHVYRQLKAIAARRSQRAGNPAIKPTTLVHEAYLKLFNGSDEKFENRRHFYWAAARAMHDVLVAEARRHSARKRGGDRQRVLLHDQLIIDKKSDELLELSDAINTLGESYPRAKEVVMLHFFAGLTHDESAEMLNISPSTVRRDWAFARAWLRDQLAENNQEQK